MATFQGLYPIIEPDKSDSASLDNVLEFLLMSGKSLPYAMSDSYT
ncbi:MAG: hypothetical protein MZV63_37185 [Marinilabiliales bacterium]|nr:hypothetical protein [Marinilabiliales bacterium]